MNEFQNGRPRDLQKQIPGCIGRMINVFDLSTGITGTKLLTDKAHRDGSPVRRSQHDVQATHELKKSSSNKKSTGTPMKMLIAQEMSKDTEPKQKPTGVVARLMGLDTLPAQQQVRIAQRSMPDSYRHTSHAHGGPIRGYEDAEDTYFGKPVPRDYHPPQVNVSEQNIYKDVYVVQQQPFRTNCSKDQHLSKGRYNENPNEKRMALVRQKFMEAKRLAADQKLLHSKEFHDALEVLSSNRDLFLKFLEEPNSLFSKHLHDLQTAPLPSQKKHITVLKPSKKVETRNEKMIKADHPTNESNELDKSKLSWKSSFVHPKAESLSQSTRIVVLKPGPGKHHDIKNAVSYPTESSGFVGGSDGFREPGSGDSKGSREVAKEVTRQMKESLSSNRRDESLLSSILNGYAGDESSLNRSENDYIEEDGGNFSDSEIVTPTSPHSWDYINRFGSPYSLSSFSRVSNSPKSSVVREAKRRLSERWAMVASNGINQEQRQLRRSSSTLGEMLAFPEIKKEEVSNEGHAVSSSRSCSGEQELRVPTCLSISLKNEEIGGEDSPRNLPRSKSVPVSSSAYEKVGWNMEDSNSNVDKSIVPKAVTKTKSGKSSFKGKVSSLFSRNKKPIREKHIPSPLVVSHDRVQPGSHESVGKSDDGSSACGSHGDGLLVNPEEQSERICSPNLENDGMKRIIPSAEAAPSPDKHQACENTIESLDQPSPISVLEAPFEVDLNNTSSESSEGTTNHDCCKMISRSPPIESVARTLSWDNSSMETTLTNSLKLSRILSRSDGEEQNRFFFVQTLLSSAGLANDKSDKVFGRWNSNESPLNPVLLNKFLEPKEEEAAAKCQERRSNQRLLFDCVNSALLDMSCTNPPDRFCAGTGGNGVPVTDEVWRRVKEWFSGEKWVTVQNDSSSRVVEGVVRNEVVGRRWTEMMGSETDEFAKGVERQLMDELVGEVLDELICGLLL